MAGHVILERAACNAGDERSEDVESDVAVRKALAGRRQKTDAGERGDVALERAIVEFRLCPAVVHNIRQTGGMSQDLSDRDCTTARVRDLECRYVARIRRIQLHLATLHQLQYRRCDEWLRH
jgi:hypothetical protein